MQVEKLVIIINDQTFSPFDIPKIRGFFAKEYSNSDLIHNHLKDKTRQYRYAYPVIQFKIIDSHPALIGIGDGIPILKKIFLEVDHLKINGEVQSINEKSVTLNHSEFGQTDNPIKYQFILPWMALNQTNYQQYQALNWNEKRAFLEKILMGNLKSISHGCNYWIPDFSSVYVESNFRPVSRYFKNLIMICFEGKFTTNFIIPDYLALGKQTARRFGTVVSTQLNNRGQSEKYDL